MNNLKQAEELVKKAEVLLVKSAAPKKVKNNLGQALAMKIIDNDIFDFSQPTDVCRILYDEDSYYMIEDNPFLNENYLKYLSNESVEEVAEVFGIEADDDQDLEDAVQDFLEEFRTEGLDVYEQLFTEYSGGSEDDFIEQNWNGEHSDAKWEIESEIENNNSNVITSIIATIGSDRRNKKVFEKILKELENNGFSKKEIQDYIDAII